MQPTLHEFGFVKAEDKLKRNLRDMLLDVKQDFNDCIVRLENYSNILDRGTNVFDEANENRNHLSLKQRRKRFQEQLMKNPYFKLMVSQHPYLLSKSNFELRFMFR